MPAKKIHENATVKLPSLDFAHISWFEIKLLTHLLQSKNEQTLLYIGVKPCAKGSIYVALEWGYLYLTFFNISNNLFDFLTSNNLGVESEAGFGM